MLQIANSKIKVLHIITDLSVGGAEVMLGKLLKGMANSQFESSVISLLESDGYREEIAALGVPIYSIGLSRAYSSLSKLWKLSGLIRKLQPDIIQSWMYHSNVAASAITLFSRQRIPILWNIRHSLYDIKYEKKKTAVIIRVGAMLSKRVSKIIYNSKTSSKQHEAFGYKAARTEIIPNGFDIERFKPSLEARQIVRRSLNIKDGDILVGMIGRYHPMKDHNNFFKAAGLVAKNNANVKYVLAGRDVDNNNESIVALVRRHELEDKVYLLGERKDMPNIFAALDIVTLSSSFGEGFPNVIGEAMACGVPCIVTDVGESAKLVGNTGKVVLPKDHRALADALGSLIAAGHDERKRLGREARDRIIKHYTIGEIARQYERLYLSVVGRDCHG